MAVLQTQVFTNNFKPVFSLVIRGGRFCRPRHRSLLDCYQMLELAKSSKEIVDDY